MGEKDVAEKRLLTYADVFANIMNVGLFQGDEVIRPEELTTILPQSTYKAEGKLRSQERDIAKLWKDSELRLALLGLENQSAIDAVMPIRIMGYDGAAYRDELNAKPVKLYPVVTVVLYFGWEKRWGKPLRLKECFRIPERLEPYVSDYHINVIEVAWLPDEVIAKFSNPFRMVAEYFSQMRKKEKYHPKDTLIIGHLPGESNDEYNKIEGLKKEPNNFRNVLTELAQEEAIRLISEYDEELTKNSDDIINSHQYFFEDL